MNIYVIIVAAVYILILMFNMNRGLRNGFVRELRGFVSIAVSIIVVVLIAGLLKGVGGAKVGRIIAIVLLVVLGLLYRFIKIALESLDSLARLPVIYWVDSLLGLIVGFIKGFAILYLLEYLLRYFLLV